MVFVVSFFQFSSTVLSRLRSALLFPTSVSVDSRSYTRGRAVYPTPRPGGVAGLSGGIPAVVGVAGGSLVFSVPVPLERLQAYLIKRNGLEA